MPRTRLAEQFAPKTPPAPPVDHIKALLLERIQASGQSAEQMADAIGCSRSKWYELRSRPTTEWTLGELLAACRHLGVEPDELRAAIRYRV